MASKADKLPLETEPVAHDNMILMLKPGNQTYLLLTQLIVIVIYNFTCEIKFTCQKPMIVHIICNPGYPKVIKWYTAEIRNNFELIYMYLLNPTDLFFLL